MLVDCMWSFGWRLEGGGEDSHKVCNSFDSLAVVVSNRPGDNMLTSNRPGDNMLACEVAVET